MKAFLITAVVCFTAITFFAASRLAPINSGQPTDQVIADALGAQLSELRNSTASEISDLKAVILAHQAEINLLTQPSEDLALERDDLADALARATAELAATTDAFTMQSTELSESAAQIAELDARLADADTTIATLNDTIASNRINAEALATQMIALQQEAESAAARIVELESQTPDAAANPNASDAEVALLQTQIAERDASLETLTDEVAELTASLEAATQTTAELEGQPTVDTSQVDALTADIAQRDSRIAALETQLADLATTGEVSTSEIAALTAALQERDATIADLTADQADSVASGDTEALNAQIADMEAQVAQLNDTMAAQTTTIDTLRLGLGDTQVSAADLAETCVARANAILELSQITFATGTTTINASSIETLERLRDLAIGCQNEDLIIEVGGHTDSQGEEDSNQIISELRAQAVLDFMIGNGLLPTDLRAVGFGETQPIADNTTVAGRAANRRITFDWQPREDELTIPEGETTEDASQDDDDASETVEE